MCDEQFIEHFDLHEGTAIELALESIFEMQPELMDDIDFGGASHSYIANPSFLASGSQLHILADR